MITRQNDRTFSNLAVSENWRNCGHKHTRIRPKCWNFENILECVQCQRPKESSSYCGRSLLCMTIYLTVWAGTCFDEHVLPSTEVRPPKGHCCRRVSTSNKPATEPLRQQVAAPRPRTHRYTGSAFGMSPHTRSNANGFSRVDSWRNAHYYCKFECKNNACFFSLKRPC